MVRLVQTEVIDQLVTSRAQVGAGALAALHCFSRGLCVFCEGRSVN